MKQLILAVALLSFLNSEELYRVSYIGIPPWKQPESAKDIYHTCVNIYDRYTEFSSFEQQEEEFRKCKKKVEEKYIEEYNVQYLTKEQVEESHRKDIECRENIRKGGGTECLYK